ncbi:heavy metal translocating P-type ATPase [Baekduia soli]|uniref:Heavy metal translocating P-type ATPase n=1 Tax=Baekduia soli TaxID=496014 RepID=A0A5B8U9Y2_9ACTN|nr:heavy metal translocating P-type ATPase [Baekduia soli]QEC49827.1 heavy metal translocating P-type ATPase [Baekduia soli]
MNDTARGPGAGAGPAWRAERGFAVLAAFALAAIVAGLVLHAGDHRHAAQLVWGATVVAVGLPLVVSVAATLAHGRMGVDVIALVAMAGALALGETLAGAVVGLMLAGGNALEAVAGRRARRELSALLARAPAVAHRRTGDRLEEVPVDALQIGDVVVVRTGEIVAVDGILVSHAAVLDESALTGESLPATIAQGGMVRSGTANAGSPFDLRASRPAAASAYAAIVRLVRDAQADRAPFVRLADRYAALLLPVTLLAAGGAWALSGDAHRALAVIVVATPCPLILAAPIALVCGVSRAARGGIIVKGAGVIERLGRIRSVLLDKTGTLTLGTPQIERIEVLDGLPEAEVLRAAASLDQLSTHVLAEALVREAHGRALELAFPEDVHEEPGEGIEGVVGGRRVCVGSPDWVRRRGDGALLAPSAGPDRAGELGLAKIAVGVDGRAAGVIVMADRLRPDAAGLITELRHGGVAHVAMVSGDRAAVAESVGESLGLDRVWSERSPQDKLEVVRAVRAQPGLSPVLMVGDGVNDAPALAIADVGIAMGTLGATASSDAADAVITVPSIAAVAEALRIGRRSLGIATQSVLAGMALSFVAMGCAAAGLIPPVAGALLQEGIDVAVILNALRALRA